MTINKAPWTTTHGWIYDADGELVGICWGKTPEEAERNAQLASAAPEMLEALEEVLEQIKDIPVCPFCQCYGAGFHKPGCTVERINEAMKKARGEE